MTLTVLRPYWLDATALVKLVHKEPGSDRVEGVVQGNAWFETTWLCVAEAHGVLKRLFSKNQITSNQYHMKLFRLRSWIEAERIRVRMTWLQPGEPKPAGSHDVRRLAEKHNLDFSDAIQLIEFRGGALAATVDEAEAVFVSSDEGLLKAAKAEGMKVWNPEVEQTPPQ